MIAMSWIACAAPQAAAAPTDPTVATWLGGCWIDDALRDARAAGRPFVGAQECWEVDAKGLHGAFTDTRSDAQPGMMTAILAPRDGGVWLTVFQIYTSTGATMTPLDAKTTLQLVEGDATHLSFAGPAEGYPATLKYTRSGDRITVHAAGKLAGRPVSNTYRLGQDRAIETIRKQLSDTFDRVSAELDRRK